MMQKRANPDQKMVISYSVGNSKSAVSDIQMKNLAQAGVIFSHAAGNSNAVAVSSHATAKDTITVGAVNSAGKRARFSNHGSNVDIFAPGVAISSASHTSNTGFTNMQGTSMACPHVSGAAALVLADGVSSMTPAEVKAKIIGFALTGVLSDLQAGSPNRFLRVDDNAIEGNFENFLYRKPNAWHKVTITNPSGDGKTFKWRNAAGVEWTLTNAAGPGIVTHLTVGSDCPYYSHGYRVAALKYAGGKVIGISGPFGEEYDRPGTCYANGQTCMEASWMAGWLAPLMCPWTCCGGSYEVKTTSWIGTSYQCAGLY